MAWLNAIAVGFLAELQTTDPTSLELAAAGVFTFLVYEMVARPRYARRIDRAHMKTPAQPPLGPELGAEGQAVGQSGSQRRVA